MIPLASPIRFQRAADQRLWGRTGPKFREACVRCSLLRPDPAQRARLADIRDNLIARISEAEREGWLGEVEGLRVSLAGADDKLAQLDAEQTRRGTATDLGMPTFAQITMRTSEVKEPAP
ncbi:hypothetical protein [Nonomuraea sp. NPDC049784]|uniref:hypothetical protein n=1 Tax=Nonomuraea sp. NPDC049784 TaxID=3154361 RepID=UPI0033E69D18